MMQRLSLLIALIAISCSSSNKGPDTLTMGLDNKMLLVDGQNAASITLTASNSGGGALPTDLSVTLTVNEGSLAGGGLTQTIKLDAGKGSTTYVCTKDKNITVTLSATTSPGTGTASDKIICGAGTPVDMTAVQNDSSLKLATTNPVIVNNGTATINATVVGVDAMPAQSGSVLFSTSLGTFGAGGGSSQNVNISAGKASLVLNAPAGTGMATITATYVDTLKVTRSAALTVRVVDQNAWSLVVDPTTDSVSAPNVVRTITATVYKGADVKPNQVVNVVLSGPVSIGTLVSKNPGGTTASDGRALSNVQTDDQGRLRVDFVSGVAAGAARIEFRFDPDTPGGNDTLTEVALITVSNAHAVASAQFDLESLDHAKIRVQGSIAPNRATLTFLFLNDKGEPVDDGTPVTFSLSDNVSGGVFVSPATTTTVGGKAIAFLNAGSQAETVNVTASSSSGGVTISATSTAIAIVGGVPEYSHFSISCDPADIETSGLAYDGKKTSCAVRLADRFSNRVDIGTQVNFRTEAGSINSTDTVVDTTGIATAVLESSLPHPSKYLIKYAGATRLKPQGQVTMQAPAQIQSVFELRSIPFASDYTGKPSGAGPVRPRPTGLAISGFLPGEALPADQDLYYSEALIQSRGDVTFIAITQGEETFVDLNGNKTYDMDEPFIDVPEPFIDKNDNGVQDSCLIAGNIPPGMTAQALADCYEDFIDLDGDHKWNNGNGHWDNFTLIWKSQRVRWNGVPRPTMYPLYRYNPDGSLGALVQTDTSSSIVGQSGLAWPTGGLGQTAANFTPNPYIYAPGASGPLIPMVFIIDWGDENGGCDPRGSDKMTVDAAATFSGSYSGLKGDIAVNDYACMASVTVTDPATSPASGFSVMSVHAKDGASAIDYTLQWGFQIN